MNDDEAFAAAMATVIRAHPRDFMVVRQERTAMRIQAVFRGFLSHPEAAKLRNLPFPLYNDSDALDDAFHKNVTCENNVLSGSIFDKDMNQGKEDGSSIMPVGLKSESRDNRGPHRVSTIAEDRMLVDILLEFHSKGHYHIDNGFAKGALTEMKTRMEITGCGLKESQRIDHRLRKLRNRWSAIHNLLTGKNCSYFGWDSDNNCVTAENDLWDAYIQAHPEAAKLRIVSFPYYHDLCIIWPKSYRKRCKDTNSHR